MKLAIRLASNQKYLTGINPSVGCVITNNNKILSYGVTGIKGKPHAEVSTIKKLKKFNLKNSKMLVCLLYTSPSPRDVEESRMPSSA